MPVDTDKDGKVSKSEYFDGVRNGAFNDLEKFSYLLADANGDKQLTK